MQYFPDVLWIDPALSLAIAVIVVIMNSPLLMTTLRILMEMSPKNMDVREVEESLSFLPGVETVRDLHIWALSVSSIAPRMEMLPRIFCLALSVLTSWYVYAHLLTLADLWLCLIGHRRLQLLHLFTCSCEMELTVILSLRMPLNCSTRDTLTRRVYRLKSAWRALPIRKQSAWTWWNPRPHGSFRRQLCFRLGLNNWETLPIVPSPNFPLVVEVRP